MDQSGGSHFVKRDNAMVLALLRSVEIRVERECIPLWTV
jgi:hypothetical protein